MLFEVGDPYGNVCLFDRFICRAKSCLGGLWHLLAFMISLVVV